MDDLVVVGRIGRPHGIKGEVSVEPRTDEPGRRFAVGNVLRARTPDGFVRPGGYTVEATRWHQGRLLITFAELADRTAAETARGHWLEIPVDPTESPADPEEFYDHQLVGLRVEDAHGVVLGEVSAVEHAGAQDLLHIDPIEPGGQTVLFPFVTALVPEVDIAGGRLVVEDRPGLFGPEQA